MNDTRHVKGLSELGNFLDQFPAKLQNNIMRSAMRAGGNVIKTEIQANIANNAQESGELRKGVKVSTRSSKGVVTASIKATGKHAYLAPWIEYGVAAHGIKKGAKRKSGKYQDGKLHPGIQPKPVFRPALDNHATEAVVAVGNQIKVRLTKVGLEAADDVEIEA